MDSLKKIHKWWWAWNYEDIENWLEQMASQGYMLMEVKGIGTHFHFDKTRPKKCRFCIDFQPRISKDYLQIIMDDGWELYPMGFGWYVWCKSYEKEKPHLYTDYDSITQRNNKLLILMLICLIPIVIGTLGVIDTFAHASTSISNYLILGLFYSAVWIFEIFAFTALLYSNKMAKKKKEFKH